MVISNSRDTLNTILINLYYILIKSYHFAHMGPFVECSVAQNHLDNVKAISASHKAIHTVM